MGMFVRIKPTVPIRSARDVHGCMNVARAQGCAKRPGVTTKYCARGVMGKRTKLIVGSLMECQFESDRAYQYWKDGRVVYCSTLLTCRSKRLFPGLMQAVHGLHPTGVLCTSHFVPDEMVESQSGVQGRTNAARGQEPVAAFLQTKHFPNC